MPIINNPGGGLPAGVLKFKGSQDCSGNPNYPAASAGDAYIVSVAGKIGGASGTTVEAGDLYTASADNAGGTQASVGTSWVVTQANVVLGTGVATALAIAVGSAGAIVVNGGALGTPSSGVGTNLTAIPISTGLTGVGTGVLTALAVNVGSAGAFTTFNGAGGTPSSLTLTNATGLPAAGVTGTAVTATTLNNATLPASVTTLAASGAVTFTGGSLTGGAGNFTFTAGTGNSRTLIFQTTTSGGVATTALTLGADQSATFAGKVSASTSGNQHTLTCSASTITFDTANVFAIRHTKSNGDGASAMAVLRHSDGFEMGAFGYKNVGAANTYLDGAIYIAGGIYSSVDGTSASATPPKIIIGQEWSGGGHVRMQFNTDRTIVFAKESGVFHTLIGADGGWQIGAGAAGATATSQFLDVMGNSIVGNYTDQSGRNTVASGWAFSICDTGANLLKLVRANVGGVDVTYTGTGATRKLAFVDEDGTNPLTLILNGVGHILTGGMIKLMGETSSFPAFKRSSAVVQARLADDSAFAQIQGKLTTDANATTGLTAGVLSALTNASITVTDASGQVYRVPVII